jgi:hypothetical protein
VAACNEALERREIADGGPSVDQQLAFSLFSHRQHQLSPFDIGRKVCDLNGHRSDRPGIALAADGGCAVGRLDLGAQRVLSALGHIGSIAGLGEEAAGLEDDEGELGAGYLANSRDNRIPLPRRRQSGDTALDPSEGPRVANLVFAQATWGSMSP